MLQEHPVVWLSGIILCGAVAVVLVALLRKHKSFSLAIGSRGFGIQANAVRHDGEIEAPIGEPEIPSWQAVVNLVPQSCVPTNGRWEGKPSAAANVAMARGASGKLGRIVLTVSEAGVVSSERYTGLHRISGRGQKHAGTGLEVRPNAYFDTSHPKHIQRISGQLIGAAVTIQGWIVRADVGHSNVVQIDLMGCEFVDD